MKYTKNDEKIYELLSEAEQPLVRKDIVAMLNMPRSTVYDALVRLMELGMIEKTLIHSRREGRRGRYPVGYIIT